MGYSLSKTVAETSHQNFLDDVFVNCSEKKYSVNTELLVHEGSVTLVLKGLDACSSTHNNRVSVITHNSDHVKQSDQNDLWAHPTALNKVIARAVEGEKSDIQYYHKNYLDHVYAVTNDNGNFLEHYRYSDFGEVEIYANKGPSALS